MKENEITMGDLVNYCKQYGFIFQGSEIYDGLANTWDFGPVGALLKDNVKKAWLKKFIQEDTNNVGLDSAILMNPKTWEASGHLTLFFLMYSTNSSLLNLPASSTPKSSSNLSAL